MYVQNIVFTVHVAVRTKCCIFRLHHFAEAERSQYILVLSAEMERRDSLKSKFSGIRAANCCLQSLHAPVRQRLSD